MGKFLNGLIKVVNVAFFLGIAAGSITGTVLTAKSANQAANTIDSFYTSAQVEESIKDDVQELKNKYDMNEIGESDFSSGVMKLRQEAVNSIYGEKIKNLETKQSNVGTAGAILLAISMFSAPFALANLGVAALGKKNLGLVGYVFPELEEKTQNLQNGSKNNSKNSVEKQAEEKEITGESEKSEDL